MQTSYKILWHSGRMSANFSCPVLSLQLIGVQYCG